MKLASVKYNKNNSHWYTSEYLPDNPRSIILYTLEGGEAEGNTRMKNGFNIDGIVKYIL